MCHNLFVTNSRTLDMTLIGYARVSSIGQSLEIQETKLLAAGVEKIFSEKVSGSDSNRPLLTECLNYVRDGDTLLITRIDRLARSTNHLHNIVADLSAQGVKFKVLDQPNVETVTSSGRLMFSVLAAIAEFENDLRKERQIDGINKAKINGVKFGRKSFLTKKNIHKIQNLRNKGALINEIQNTLDISKSTVYRALRMK